MARKPPPELNEEEQSQWEEVARQTRPLAKKTTHPRPVTPKKSQVKQQDVPVPAPLTAREATAAPLEIGNVAGLDRNTAARFRKGQLPIDARLDLHGMTLPRAQGEVERFIPESYASGLRLLLVITGKGRTPDMAQTPIHEKPRSNGTFRDALPHWLAQPCLRRYIVAVAPAGPKHGGGGAWYIYLRKQRP